jgi:tetratricopeptide (TPR) repeat protein
LGDAFLQLHQWKQAAEAYQRAIELNPDFAWSYYNLGEALAELGDWEEVVIAYSRANKLQSDLPLINQKLADARYKRAQFDLNQTTSWYQEEILSNPEDLQNYYRLIEAQPDNPELYLKLGDLLLKQNQREQSIAFYKIALQIEPNNSEIVERLRQFKS